MQTIWCGTGRCDPEKLVASNHQSPCFSFDASATLESTKYREAPAPLASFGDVRPSDDQHYVHDTDC